MSDATIEVEAKIDDQITQALKVMQGEMRRLEHTSFESFRKIEKQLGDAEKKSRDTANGMSKAFSQAQRDALKLAGAYVGLSQATQLITDSVGAALQLERVDRGLKFVTGSSEGAAEEFGFVRSEAERLGLELRTAALEYTKMAAAAQGTSLAGQATRDVFTGVSEAATTLGLSGDQVGGALTALQQIISKGTVQSEELRGQLGERLPGAFQIAARAMGVTTQQLGKMLEQGQVISSEFIPKFSAQLHTEFGEAAIEASTGAQSSFNRFNNAVLEAKAALGEHLLPTVVSFTQYIAQEAIPFWGEFIQGFSDGAKDAKAMREEMIRLRDAQGTGTMAIGPEMEIEARKNLAERKKFLAEAEVLAKQERDLRMGERRAPSRDASSVATKLTEDQKKVIALQEELEKSRIQVFKDGEQNSLKSIQKATQDRLALEDAEYKSRMKALQGNHAAQEVEEKIHAQNQVNIRMDGFQKARELEVNEFRQAQKEAVKADEARTKQIYDARQQLAEAQAGADPIALLKVKQEAELAAIDGNEKAKADVIKRHAIELQNTQKQVDEKALEDKKKIYEAQFNAAETLAGGLTALAAQGNMKDRAARMRWKAMAEVEAGVNLLRAEMQALADPSLSNPIAKVAAMTGIGVLGLAKMNAIKEAKFAVGTLNAPGGTALVGERGPELIQLPRGSRVFNNSESRQMMGGGPKLEIGQINITLPGPVTQAGANMVAETVERRLKRLVDDLEAARYRGMMRGPL